MVQETIRVYCVGKSAFLLELQPLDIIGFEFLTAQASDIDEAHGLARDLSHERKDEKQGVLGTFGEHVRRQPRSEVTRTDESLAPTDFFGYGALHISIMDSQRQPSPHGIGVF